MMFPKSIAHLKRLNRTLSNPWSIKEIEEFCMFESFLLFCFEKLGETNVNQCFNYLKKYHKCGKSKFGELDFLLDNICNKYASFAKKSNFQKNLSLYFSIDEILKIFVIEDDTLTLKDVDKLDLRYKEYSCFWLVEEDTISQIINYDITIYDYEFKYKGNEYVVNLNDMELKGFDFPKVRKKSGTKREFTVEELFEYAKEMDEILLTRHGFSKNYVDRLNRTTINLLKNGVLSDSKTINLEQVVHILGMVGSGKSTLMHILSYGAMLNQSRVMLVFETVKEVHETAQLFKKLGFSTAVVTGKSTIEKQINQISEEGDQVLAPEYSAYYTGACPLQGAIVNYSRLDWIPLGAEPCHSLMYQDKRYTCPFYLSCPRKYEERKIATADLIITTVHSLIYGKMPILHQQASISLLEFVCDYIDLVMFDEVDKVQVSLDDIFSQIYSLKELVINNNEIIHAWEHPVYQDEYSEVILHLSNSYQNFKQYQFKIHKLLREDNSKKIISMLNKQKCVTPNIIIEKLVDSPLLYESLISYYRESESQNEDTKRILVNFENSLLGTGSSPRVEFIHLKNYFSNVSTDYMEFKFIMLLICLDKALRTFLNLCEELEYDDKQKLEVPRININPFRHIQRFVPEAPLKHIYGYIYDDEKKDLRIFRQFGLGRSLLLDLPFIKLTNTGDVLGPNVILFSGTSFSPGSYRFHIEREVKYILEPNKEIQDFIKKLEITIIPTDTKVSGVWDKEKALLEILNVCKFNIQNELNYENRILMIVNSYDQCQIVKTEINNLWGGTVECFALVPDTAAEGMGNIKRGDVEKLDKIAPTCDVLIAPATVIERGFNIVGDDGHSLFSTLFFLVRPMEVPKDLNRLMIQINGLTYSCLKEYQKDNQKIDYPALMREVNVLWEQGLKDYYETGNMPDILKNEIVISRFILIMQIVGRLLRITNLDKTPPHIYFADEAFIKSGTSNFNILEEICQYIEGLLTNDDYRVLAELLYLPFYEALRKGLGKTYE